MTEKSGKKQIPGQEMDEFLLAMLDELPHLKSRPVGLREKLTLTKLSQAYVESAPSSDG